MSTPALGEYKLDDAEMRTFDICTRKIVKVVLDKKHHHLSESAVLRLAITEASRLVRGQGLIDSHAVATAFNMRRADRSRSIRDATNYTQHMLREEAKTGSVVCYRGQFYRIAGARSVEAPHRPRRDRRPGGRNVKARCKQQVVRRPFTERTDSTITRSNVKASVDAERRAERKEMTLQNQLLAWTKAQGRQLDAPEVPRRDGSEVILPDGVDFETGDVFEAKGSTRKESVRMAIGQVLDYVLCLEHLEGRSFTPVVVLPARPVEDLVELCYRTGIDLLYREDADFVRLPAKK